MRGASVVKRGAVKQDRLGGASRNLVPGRTLGEAKDHLQSHGLQARAGVERPLRILYLTLQRTTEGQAAHAHVHEIVGWLRQFRHEVELIEPRLRDGASLPERLVVVGCVLARFLQRIVRGRPDVVYQRQHILSFVSTLLARAAGIPVVLELNGPPRGLSLSWPLLRRFDNLAERVARFELRLATRVVAVTDQLAGWANRARGPTRSPASVIPNGANTSIMRPIPNPDIKEFGLEPMRYVIFAGTLAPWQGIDDMIAAVQSPSWPDGVRLAICGDGREASKVAEAARRSERITFLGVVPYLKMPHLISGSLGGLAPKTDPRGLFGAWAPLKVFEYLACGRPVIVSSLPNLPEIVENAGLVVPPGNPDVLAKAVAWLARQPEAREQMGLRGRALAESRYSWRARAEDTERVLVEVVLGGQNNASGHCQ